MSFRKDYRKAIEDWLELSRSTLKDIQIDHHRNKYIVVDGYKVYLPDQINSERRYRMYLASLSESTE